MGRGFHVVCFACEKCRKPLSGHQYNLHEHKPYCIDCISEILSIKCAGCEKAIKPTDKYLDASGKSYHSGCFRCAVID